MFRILYPVGLDLRGFWTASIATVIAITAVAAGALSSSSFKSYAASPQEELSVQDRALVIAHPRKKPEFSWNYTSVFFVTNRKIDEDSVDHLRKGIANRFDDYYSNTADVQTALGQACVAYPTDRKVAEQDYPNIGDAEVPARDFVIKGSQPITATSDFETAMAHGGDPSFTHYCPESTFGSEETPILFVHGWATSFSAAVTRGSQLKLDLNRRLVVVVSWPSDKLGLYSYASAEEAEKSSLTLVPYSAAIVKEATGRLPSIIAHSMGARLYNDSVRNMVSNGGPFQGKVPATILAAPDVDSDSFLKGFNLFRETNHLTTVYCGDDNALRLSGVDHWDRRLGYCKISDTKPIAPEALVRVTGKFKDTWHHSYFLSAPEMIHDMNDVLSRGEQNGNIDDERTDIPVRNLELH